MYVIVCGRKLNDVFVAIEHRTRIQRSDEIIIAPNSSYLVQGNPKRLLPIYLCWGKIYLDIKESRDMFARVLGRFEPNTHQAIETFLSKGSTFIDIGVNKGDYALLSARIVGQHGKVFAFEPAPMNCSWIKKSIKLNGYTNIELHEIALSDANGSAELRLADRSCEHTLLPIQRGRVHQAIAVKIQTLDDFLETVGWTKPIAMIKIDVEGAELNVLKGATKTLSANKDIIVLMDIHPSLGVNPKDICTYLEDKGFTIFHERPPFDVRVDEYANLHEIIARRI